MPCFKLVALFAALWFAAPVAAQTTPFDVLLVDSSDPDYDTIQEVVDLAPLNAVILIPPGDYTSEMVTIDNKSLVFLRYDPAGAGGAVKVGRWTIQNLGEPRRVVIRGLLFIRYTAFQPNLTVTNSRGAVLVESCRLKANLAPLYIPPGQAAPAVSLEGVASEEPAVAHFVRCQIDGVNGSASSQYGQDRVAGEGISAEFHEVTVFECLTTGGAGAPGADGAPGARLRGSALHLSGGSLVGGDGGMATGTPCVAGDGGAGIAGADQMGDPVSVASFVGLPTNPLAGGAGGPASGSCTAGSAGPPATLAGPPDGQVAYAATIEVPELVFEGDVNVPLDFAPTSANGPYTAFTLYASRSLDYVPSHDPEMFGVPIWSVAVIGAAESNYIYSTATSPILFNPTDLLTEEGEARVVYLQGLFWAPGDPPVGAWSAPTVSVVLDPNFDPEVSL